MTLWSSSGVVRNDGSYKPSWFTYATLIRQLDGVTGGTPRAASGCEKRGLYSWTRERDTAYAWAVEGAAKAELKLGQCTVTDAFGDTRPTELQTNVPLSILPIYISDISPRRLGVAEGDIASDRNKRSRR